MVDGVHPTAILTVSRKAGVNLWSSAGGSECHLIDGNSMRQTSGEKRDAGCISTPRRQKFISFQRAFLPLCKYRERTNQTNFRTTRQGLSKVMPSKQQNLNLERIGLPEARGTVDRACVVVPAVEDLLQQRLRKHSRCLFFLLLMRTHANEQAARREVDVASMTPPVYTVLCIYIYTVE